MLSVLGVLDFSLPDLCFPDWPVNVTVQMTCFSELQNQPDGVQISNTLSTYKGRRLSDLAGGPWPWVQPEWLLALVLPHVLCVLSLADAGGQEGGSGLLESFRVALG